VPSIDDALHLAGTTGAGVGWRTCAQRIGRAGAAALVAAALSGCGSMNLGGLLGGGNPTASNATGGAAPLATSTTATRAPATPPTAAERRAYDAAVSALAAGRDAEAERAFADLAARRPDLPGPQANLAVLHERQGRTAEAVTAWERAVALRGDDCTYTNALGVAYRRAGRLDDARSAYERALANDPGCAPAARNLAILDDVYLDHPADALPNYRRYQALSPDDAQVGKWIADVERRIGKAARSASPTTPASPAPETTGTVAATAPNPNATAPTATRSQP